MNYNHHQHYFLLLCLTASLIVLYFIIQPFLTPLILAAVFVYLFQPLNRKLLDYTRNRASLAALATAVVAIVIVLLPLAGLGTLILKEASELYQALAEDRGNFIEKTKDAVDWIRGILPLPENLEFNVNHYARQGLGFLTSSLGAVFSSLAKIFMNAFVFIVALYFLFKDGQKLKDYVVALSPLADRDDEMIASRLGLAVSAVVKGNLLIGIIQGTLTGIGFAIFGVPNAALWGSVAAIAALIPGIGTALVITPAIIFLFLSGNTFGGVGLLAWGMTAVGLIDNFLGPKLVGRGMQLHPLAVFLAVLGGMAFFGPLGFLLGPLATSVCFALIDIYTSLKKREGENPHA